MNKLDLLMEKKRKHGERLTVIEKIILAYPDPRLQLEAAAELAGLQSAASELTGLVRHARRGSLKTISVEEIAAIVDTLTMERARMKDHSSLKRS
jgi:hypothetical protein